MGSSAGKQEEEIFNFCFKNKCGHRKQEFGFPCNKQGFGISILKLSPLVCTLIYVVDKVFDLFYVYLNEDFLFKNKIYVVDVSLVCNCAEKKQ